MSLEVTDNEMEGESVKASDDLLLRQQVRVDRRCKLLLSLQEGVLLSSHDANCDLRSDGDGELPIQERVLYPADHSPFAGQVSAAPGPHSLTPKVTYPRPIPQPVDNPRRSNTKYCVRIERPGALLRGNGGERERRSRAPG